jgi:alpha-L-rhamnosidase
MRICLFFLCFCIAFRAISQTPSPITAHPNTAESAQSGAVSKWNTGYWEARWVVCPTAQARQYGVYHFRKTITLAQKPAQFVVHVSADNRYRLFVNGRVVGFGPARSDTQNWHFETFDLAPYLQAGPNIIAAQVWYLSDSAPFAQMSYQQGFIMQGEGEPEKILNTPNGWKAYQNPAYAPHKGPSLNTYSVVGDGDRVDAARYPWGWEQLDFDDQNWADARPLWFLAKTRGYGTDGNWALVARTIPTMESHPDRLQTVRRAEYVKMPDAFLQGTAPVTIPAQTRAVFLLDRGQLTNAYPELTVSGGKGATVTLAYAEALVDEKGQKGNRNNIDGRKLVGIEDQFLPDGAANRLFRPLWFRTYRYLQITVETSREPLTLNDLVGQFTGYPFQEKAAFTSNDSTLGDIWNVGWRTAKLCAGETYFDCPYYEQLQYVGDTRVQSIISLYVAGDDRLMKKAISDYDHSRFNDGLTQSRYPSADFQVIPTFSLFWVCMVHDYWMHRTDDNFVKQFLPGIASVLAWHEDRLDKSGLNGPLVWWNFVDWSWSWSEEERTGGVPSGGSTGGSSILTLQQAYTFDRAADLMAHYGQNDQAAHYRSLALRMKKAVQERCYDTSRGLVADTQDKKIFSQHANILAVLTDAVPVAQQRALLQKTMTDTSLTQATFYFKFYLFEALKKTGLGDQLIPQLKPWRTMLDMGLTTFAEQPEPTRSDCHAWSASPVYEFISTVCGINAAEPGFRSVRIEPFLGDLKTVSGKMPHPLGEVSVQFVKTPTGGLTGTVTLPPGLTGILRWNGKTMALVGGAQMVAL